MCVVLATIDEPDVRSCVRVRVCAVLTTIDESGVPFSA